MKKSIIIFLAILCLPFVASAQKLTGRVIDANTSEPLVGASLYWKNTTAGASTTANGSFTLKRVHGFDTLVVDYLGYDIWEQELSDRDASNVFPEA